MAEVKIPTSATYDNKAIFASYAISGLFFFLSLILVILNFTQLPPEIPIFYSAKTQILANKNFIWLIPVLVLSNLILNLTIGKLFFFKNQFLAKAIALNSAIVAFLIFWSEFQIVSLF